MANANFDTDKLFEIGQEIGLAAGAIYDGIMAGLEAWELAKAAEDVRIVHETEEGLRQPSEKTAVGDCRKCWCDRCANIEQCESLLEGALPDGVRPFPCVGCEDGMRFMPEEEPPCEFFKEAKSRNNG